jgi:hypothetical protein
MDEGWGRAVAAIGLLVLGLLLMGAGPLLVSGGGGLGWIVLLAGAACLVGAVLIVT